jgi:Ca2+-binding EF-hand superfamily protein
MKANQFLIAGAVAALLPLSAAIAQSSPQGQPQSAPSDPAGQTQPAPQQKGATFESLDSDSDGRISKTEAAANQNVLDQFSRYDKDGNGFIERAEVMSANKPPSSGESQQ